MTFGKDLVRLGEANPRYADYYINYKELKEAVDQVNVGAVMALLRKELDKINDMVDVEWDALSGELRSRRRSAEKSGEGADLESLDNLAQAVVNLYVFVDVNFKGFQKIMQKCSARLETSSCAWFLSRVEAASFRQRSFDELLVPLGQLFAAYRQHHSTAAQETTTQLAAQALPSVGEGNAQVFLVPADHVMRAKVALVKLLQPVGGETKVKTTQGTRDASKVRSSCSQHLVHIFLEGTAGDQYAERYKRRVGGFAAAAGPAGVLLYCRVGEPPEGEGGAPGDPANPKHMVEIFVEDEKCSTSSFSVQQSAMTALLEGKVEPKVGGPAAQAAATAIVQGHLKPAVSASFNRSSFSAKAGPELVSIEENLSFRDEAALLDPKAWCFAASKSKVGSWASAQVEFPGAILKVWLPPAGAKSLLSLLNLGDLDLKPVPGFSEGLHGMAVLHRELATPLPPWIPSDTLTPADKRSTLLEPPRAEQPAPKKATEVKAAKKPKKDESADKLKVDCKTPMAIERTLLRWMRSTVLLASLSSFLVAGGTFSMQLNGFLLGLVSVVFVILPTRSYFQRSLELQYPKHKPGEATQPKVDRALPRLMAWSMSMILACTLVVSVVAGGEETP